MSIQTVTVTVCDNCGGAAETSQTFTIAHGRLQRVIDAGEECGCAHRLQELMDKGRIGTVTLNGRKRGRPSNVERLHREQESGSRHSVAATG